MLFMMSFELSRSLSAVMKVLIVSVMQQHVLEVKVVAYVVQRK